jgi:glycosyltransferase involved in cell wall biosynthesis
MAIWANLELRDNWKRGGKVRVIFISFMNKDYSRTGTYFSALTQSNVECLYIQVNPRTIIADLNSVNRENQNSQFIVLIGSASQLLVIPARIILGKKVFLDAGWSLVESTMVNSSRRGKLWGKAVKSYLIDFFAARVSQKIFLESNSQVDWYRKILFVSKKKCVTLYTGVDETQFFPIGRSEFAKSKSFTVLFRGKFNTEAGLEVLAEATLILSDMNINFIVLSNVQNSGLIFSEKTLVINNYFDSKGELANLLVQADLSLGQLSDHHRLRRTIPHKAYESAFLGIPYLTARNGGILEIFEEDEEVFCFTPGSAVDLARKVVLLSKNPELLQNSAKKIQAKYQQNLNQQKLGERLLGELGRAWL